MAKVKMTECYVYLRVSGKGQVGDDKDGFTRQYLACEKWAQDHNCEITQVFREEGVSGKNDLDGRPALQTLFGALNESGVTVVVIERLDRIARDLMVQETIIAEMRKSGYELISTAEPDLCSDDPSRKLVRQIFGAIAEYDRSMLVLKLRGARERKRLRGERCEGQKPFGSFPGEMPTLRLIYELRKERKTMREIATVLNEKELPTRFSKQWSAMQVHRILARDIPGDVTFLKRDKEAAHV